jgi:hypothetical protein
MESINMVNYLSVVSNKNIFINILMHLLVIGAIVSLWILKTNKFKKYIINGTVLILFLSIIINATIYGNPFHGITFAILAGITLFALIKSKNQFDKPEKGLNTIISFGFIILGLWYPEFVSANILQYFLVSPLGIVPCPTLITTLGILNLFFHKLNKMQFVVIVFFGIIYGFIGTFIFRIYYDLFLIGISIYSAYNILTAARVNR